uniref:TRZ/ATZ family protein n=1 Tax=Caldimicrobium thiodismutans TaxID=1653476 RepID=A0A832LW41_9BACT
MQIVFPLRDREELLKLRAGDLVSLDGWLLCARDATHKKILSSIKEGTFKFDFTNQLIYYVGPTPAPPGKIMGSCGPTTAGRMDAYMSELLSLGLAATMGKGKRSPEVRALHQRYKAVYFITFGGAGAYLSQFVKKMEVLSWEELGPEAFFRIKVEGFPAIVGIDTQGLDFYELSSAITPP